MLVKGDFSQIDRTFATYINVDLKPVTRGSDTEHVRGAAEDGNSQAVVVEQRAGSTSHCVRVVVLESDLPCDVDWAFIRRYFVGDIAGDVEQLVRSRLVRGRRQVGHHQQGRDRQPGQDSAQHAAFIIGYAAGLRASPAGKLGSLRSKLLSAFASALRALIA